MTNQRLQPTVLADQILTVESKQDSLADTRDLDTFNKPTRITNYLA